MYGRIYADIDLDAIVFNLKSMKKNVKSGTKMCGVVKADGYGHGAVAVAKAIEPFVWGYAVATIEEAIELRKNQVTKPVLILGYIPVEAMEIALKLDVRMTIFSLEDAVALSELALSMEKDAFIHIKLDTGMSRIGMQPTQETVDMIEQIVSLPNIVLEGVFTHMATADEVEKERALKQVDKFDWVCEQLNQKGIHIPIRHCSNSAGIVDLPQVNKDMVRCGISLYGMYPSEEVKKENVPLKSALSLKSEIVYVKTIEEGTTVGYNATFTAKRKTKVATIPVGYADGYPRGLSNKGWVLIRGQKAPIIGRICMDQFMVDVTDIPDVQREDVVTLIGVDGKERISVEEMANLAGSFNYEFVCNLSKRVPRFYWRHGQVVGKKSYFYDNYGDLL